MTSIRREKYFFDIPVYRCTPEKYRNEINTLEKEHTQKYDGKVGDKNYKWWMDLFYRFQHPGPWRFNQIIGYIRLFVDFGRNVIKAEYWRIQQKRINRIQGKKKFNFNGGNAIEVWFRRNETSANIFLRLSKSLEAIRKEKRFQKRYIDLTAFYELGPFIDWRSFIDA